MSPTAVEAIGYLASALIVVSLAMTSVLKLRILSLLGSTAYVVYGLFLAAWPIVIANAIIAGLNVWNIYKVLNKKDMDLGVSPIAMDAPYLNDFLAASRSDIEKFQPVPDFEEGDQAWLLLRDALPAGVLIGAVEGDTLEVSLDYVRPPYRDLKLGDWLFGAGFGDLGLRGVKQVASRPGSEQHQRYLRGLGFEAQGDRMVRAAG